MMWSINVQWGADTRTVPTGIEEADVTCGRVRACPIRDLVGPRPLKLLQDAALKRLMVAAKRVRNGRRELARTGGDWRVELIKMAKSEYLMRPPLHELGPGLEAYVPLLGDAIAEPARRRRRRHPDRYEGSIEPIAHERNINPIVAIIIVMVEMPASLGP